MINELIETFYRSILSVGSLFLLARLMGKKQMAQLTFFDYTVGISIGSIAAQCAVDKSIELPQEIMALVVFTLFSIILSIISAKSYIGRRLLDGTPTILIENGKIIESGLKKNKLNVNDLMEECRQRNAYHITDIAYAILETSGRLSVMLKPEYEPITPQDMHMAVEDKGLCASVIIDGKVMEGHLRVINRDRDWLDAALVRQQIKNISDILLAYVDGSGNLSIHLKNVEPECKVL